MSSVQGRKGESQFRLSGMFVWTGVRWITSGVNSIGQWISTKGSHGVELRDEGEE